MNKAYGVNEYEKLCAKIIEHMRSTWEWGEFFPTELSPFWYDETVAMEHFPITENEARERWWKWKGEEETSSYHGPYYTALPIQEYNEKLVGYETAQKNIDELLNWILQCAITKKPFKIIKQELGFHIEHNLPLPEKHPDQRHKERISQKNPRKIYERFSTECHKNITTTFAPDRSENIVCEDCYRKLVF